MAMIESTVRDRVLFVVFKDEPSRNSFSVRAAEELERVINADLAAIQAIVFTASGRVFCSGGNLSDYAAMTDSEQGKQVNRRITEVLRFIDQLKVPTVCAVNGDCFGGGIELASAFDIVYATPHSLFGFWQRKIGLTFGWGGGARIEERVGTGILKRLALSTSDLTAHEALSVGLIDGVFPEAKLINEAESTARTLAHLPMNPVKTLKNWESRQEQSAFEDLWWNEEHQRVLSRRR